MRPRVQRGVQPSVRPSDVMAMLREQNFRCRYTGDELTPENTSADHVQPVSRGGAHEVANVCLVTREVNSAKGSLTLAEFVALCRKVAGQFEGVPLDDLAASPGVCVKAGG